MTSITTARADMIAQMIADFTARRDTLADLIAPKGFSIICDAPFVVVCDGLAIDFDVEETDGVRRAINARPGKVESVRRFSRESASTVAAETSNGNGTIGVAMFWKDAVAAQIAQLDKTIADVSALAA